MFEIILGLLEFLIFILIGLGVLAVYYIGKEAGREELVDECREEMLERKKHKSIFIDL